MEAVMLRKESIINFLFFLFRISWIIGCVYLFKAGHYFLASIMVIGYIESIFSNLREAGKNRKVELSWMSQALIDKQTLKNLQEESRVYAFIHNCIAERKVKEGMTIKELYDIFKEINSDKIEWMLHAEDPLSEFLVTLEGYGYNLPTPTLKLYFKNGKLTGWKKAIGGKYYKISRKELMGVMYKTDEFEKAE